MDPGCINNWMANVTLRNSSDGKQRLVHYENHKNLKGKRIDNFDQ